MQILCKDGPDRSTLPGWAGGYCVEQQASGRVNVVNPTVELAPARRELIRVAARMPAIISVAPR